MAAEFTTEMGMLAGITELNNRFECFVGEEEPNPTYPCMFWANRVTGILKQRNVSNDGWVTLYSLATGVLSLLDSVYPIGTVYENGYTDENPATLFGFGTWEPFGEGRVTVGVDTNQTEFDVLGKIGGEKDHSLTIEEMPSHRHDIKNGKNQVVSSLQFAQGGESAAYEYFRTGGSYKGIVSPFIQNIGSNQPHNNLQPYITVHRWIRVA